MIHHRRISLYVPVLIMLILMIPTLLAAASMAQPDQGPFGEAIPPENEAEIPLFTDGVPYQYPFMTTPPGEVISAPTDPTITVWYGDTQNFTRSTPQLWINILGNVTGATELSYTLNGGPAQSLNIGSDLLRLFGEGDFNIELPVIDLVNGANTVVITAGDNSQASVNRTVTVNYNPTVRLNLPYTVDWSTLGGNIQNGAQVVDGLWRISNGNLAVVDPGYDRLVAIGDIPWGDYEATVPVTVKSWNSTEWGAPSNGGGVGLMVHWRGHTRTSEEEQPQLGWRRFGGLAWFRITPNLRSRFELLGNGGRQLDSRTDRQLELNRTYMFKISVQASTFASQPATYRFKFWEMGTPEPAEWYLSSIGRSGEPATGSLVLIALQSMVEFGDVEVTPLPTGPFTITKQPTPNGQIIIEPQKASYAYGETVQLRAVGNNGYKLANWGGDFSGNVNPITFDITSNVTVGATFAAAATQPNLNISVVGGGTVAVDANPPYLYGQLVTLTPQPQANHVFAGWSGDLTGADSPVELILDESKNITSSFTPISTASPLSDDFNACELNTDLWTFINPVGDGSYVTTGTRLDLIAPAGVAHDIWTNGNDSVRIMQPTQDNTFEIITKFDSTLSRRYQMQGILVEENNLNFIRFEIYHDGSGNKAYAVIFTDGIPNPVILTAYIPSTPSYLRVTRVDDSWSYSYSMNGDIWTNAGSFTHDLFVTQTGVYAANQASTGQAVPAHTAILDYFFNSAAPIVPEDGIPVNAFTIDVSTIGNGSVSVDPEKDTYLCNEVVDVTAEAAAGWNFAGWQGDLTGTNPQQQLIMTRNYQLTAVFTEGGQPPQNRFIYFPVIIR